MGQFVSRSEVVNEVEGRDRQLFTEHNGIFVPVVKADAVYKISVGSRVERVVCELRGPLKFNLEVSLFSILIGRV